MCSFLILPLEVYKKVEIDRVNRFLKLRGPDKTNVFIYENYVFIHNLLHICGEETSQPFVFEDEGIVALFNGEIYNYREFDENYTSDGQCLIPLYKEFGEAFPQKLDGEFAIALFDFKNQMFLISTDIFATKPIHYCIYGQSVLISSFGQTINDVLGYTSLSKSIKNSLTAKARDREHRNRFIDKLAESFPTSSPEVLRLSHNRTLSFSLSSFSQLQKSSIYTFNLLQHKDQYDDWNRAFENAVLKRAAHTNDRKICIALSSGHDSGAIACCLEKHRKTFSSYTYFSKEDRPTLEKRLSSRGDNDTHTTLTLGSEEYRILADNLRQVLVKMENTKINSFDVVDHRASVALHKIMDISKKKDERIFLSGQGGDEIFSNYGRLGTQVNSGKFTERHCTPFPEDLESIFPWGHFFNRNMENFIKKEELIGSIHGVEVRYPFLDKLVVQEFLWLTAKLKNTYYKSCIHHYLSKNHYPVLDGFKMGFKV